MNILIQAARANVPFMVVEPAKAEYRSLLRAKLGQPLYIFTAGNERVSPLRLNPFEPVEGTSVSVHLDLLRSAFNASMGMWNPLPQVLEQCLHAVYRDRGWDLSSDTNERGGTRSTELAFPTLSDLLSKVDEITPQLGYDTEIEANIRASLRTRLNALSSGGKGRMLDTHTSTSSEILFGNCVVLELEEMGDDDDKAFIMALMLIKGWEFLRKSGETKELKHLLVIEEAHRLLTNVQSKSAEEGNARGKAVEGFTNLLSEIRAFGQGIIIADQVPSRLAPDVIKNTNLKIAQRIVALDDRQVFAGAMAMSEEQSVIVSTLDTGQAAVYALGIDSPLLIQIPNVRDQLGEKLPTADEVKSQMMPLIPVTKGHWACKAPLENQNACELARLVAESQTFQRDLIRLVLACTELSVEVALNDWSSLQSALQAVQRPGVDVAVLRECTFSRASQLMADRWGARAGWTYEAVNRVRALVYSSLMALQDKDQTTLESMSYALKQVNARHFLPFRACGLICSSVPPRCMFRATASDLALQTTWRTAWSEATLIDRKETGSRANSWEVAMDAAALMVGERGGSGAPKSAALCFSQVMLYGDPTISAAVRDVAMQNLIDASGI